MNAELKSSVLAESVRMLKPNQRRILDLASVIGDKFDVELLGSVLGQGKVLGASKKASELCDA